MKKSYNPEELGSILIDNSSIKERAGTFSLITNGGEVFENERQRNELRLIMESLIIIQCTHISSIDQLCYVALCEQFRPVKKGENIPTYIPMFSLNEENELLEVIWEEKTDYFKSKG